MSEQETTRYCPNCGEELSEVAEYCPSCGGSVNDVDQNKTRIGQLGYTILGIVSGLVALFLFPPVFGIISILSGVQIFRHHNERRGIAILAWGGIALISGVLIGIYTVGG